MTKGEAVGSWMIVLALCGAGRDTEPEQQRAPEAAQTNHAGDIVVTARAEHRVGHDTAASAGAVSGDDLRRRPLLRTNELAEAVPGLLAVQHSGGGKAAQYYIRGFNLDHGTDFSVSVDGVPMNLPTQAHAQGYLDLNGLIPETVARLEYRKGPYEVRDGDFSLVAAADMTTLDHAAPSLSLEAGSFGYRRVAAIASSRIGAGELLLAGELKANNGPWALAERLRHAGALAKYTVPTSLGTLRLTASDYNATWRPTEQVPVRTIGTLLPDRFGTLDPFLRGRTSRQIVSAALSSSRADLVLYAQRYRFDLLSNFTFFLDDPVRGDELEQTERRSTWGMRGRHALPFGDGLTLTVGGDARIDQIDDLGFYQTERGRRIATRSLADVRETSIAGYAELRWQPWSSLTARGGARVDHYRFHSRARGGSAVDAETIATVVTPKASVALTVSPGVALYANYGQGFHSNDARGVLAATNPVPALVRGTGYELGIRVERGPVALTLDRWWLHSSGELVYLGDSGTVEPRGPSRRRGWEVTLYARAASWLTVDATVATNHARFVNAPDADRIPNALEDAGALGVTMTAAPWTAALRIRRIGPRPLTEDDSVRGEATMVVNARVGRSLGRVEASLDLLNVLDSRRADADYFYTSRLHGEPLNGVEGVHARAVEPRQARIALRLEL